MMGVKFALKSNNFDDEKVAKVDFCCKKGYNKV